MIDHTAAEAKGARLCLLIASALVVLVNLPLVASNMPFGGDDWAWIWTYHAHGASRIFQLMLDSGHPGFAPVLAAFFWLGGEIPGHAAHVIGVLCLLGSAWMLWRIFAVGRDYTIFATAIAIAYLLSPFLGGLRASIAHDVYDVFIFSYLGSIWLSSRPGSLAQCAAVITCAIGLSIETLAVFEFIRWWHLSQSGYSGKALIARSLPYLVLIALLFVSRVTWLVPKGVFAGYNAIEHPGVHEILRLVFVNLFFFADIRQPLLLLIDLVRYDSILVTAVILVGTLAVALTLPASPRALTFDKVWKLALLGVALLFAGLVPYVAIGREASRADVSSRFAAISQFGALILIALVIVQLRPKALRIAAMAAFVLLFAANQLQLDKWLIYESQVVADFRKQIGRYLENQPPMVLLVDFEPSAKSFVYLRRSCLSSYDTNISLELSGERHGSFVYDRDCGAQVYHDPAGCLMTGYDQSSPCPADERDVRFTIDSSLDDFTKLKLFDLLPLVDRGPSLPPGTLTPTNSEPSRPAPG